MPLGLLSCYQLGRKIFLQRILLQSMRICTLIALLIILNILCICCLADNCDQLLKSADELMKKEPPDGRGAADKYDQVKNDCPAMKGEDLLCKMAAAYNTYDEVKRNKVCNEMNNKEDCAECREPLNSFNDPDPLFNQIAMTESTNAHDFAIEYGLSYFDVNASSTGFISNPIVISNSLYRNSSFFVSTMDPTVSWDFESGVLRGWNKSGNAFDHQPVQRGRAVTAGMGSFSGEGNFWVTSYEMYPGLSSANGAANVTGDSPTGALESLPFVVRGESISFLLGGGRNCSVDLLADDQIVFTAAGNDTDKMHMVTWNVTSLKGKEAVLLVVDNSSEKWGHVNFDDVKFDIAPTVMAVRKR